VGIDAGGRFTDFILEAANAGLERTLSRRPGRDPADSCRVAFGVAGAARPGDPTRYISNNYNMFIHQYEWEVFRNRVGDGGGPRTRGVLNDPRRGGTHRPGVTVVRPVFAGEAPSFSPPASPATPTSAAGSNSGAAGAHETGFGHVRGV
jgi:hypothetical protein